MEALKSSSITAASSGKEMISGSIPIHRPREVIHADASPKVFGNSFTNSREHGGPILRLMIVIFRDFKLNE